MRVHEITEYDVGQVLIRASDNLFECAHELRQTKPELAYLLYHMGCEVGSAFNKGHYPQQFGLRALNECTCPKCVPSKGTNKDG